jgi:CRISPR/Cas system-associated protein Csx1
LGLKCNFRTYLVLKDQERGQVLILVSILSFRGNYQSEQQDSGHIEKKENQGNMEIWLILRGQQAKQQVTEGKNL